MPSSNKCATYYYVQLGLPEKGLVNEWPYVVLDYSNGCSFVFKGSVFKGKSKKNSLKPS